MGILVNILIGIAILIAIIAAIGMLLPRYVPVKRSLDINAPADKIFPHFNNLANTVPWSPWLHHDPDCKLTYNDIAEGKGASLEWSSDHKQVGKGKMVITESRLNEHLAVDLDFGKMGSAKATWDLEPNGDATKATWGMVADMGKGPIGRLMGVMMDKWVGADYEKGLQNLKKTVEG